MTIECLSKAQLARDLGYTDGYGKPSPRAIAQCMREALLRWGMCPRRALFAHARAQLRAFDIPTDVVPQVLEQLVNLGECEEVGVGHEEYVVPAEARWIDCGGGRAVLLGPVAPPSNTPRLDSDDHTDVAIRVHLKSEEQAAALEARGVRQTSLSEWLQPLTCLKHVSRRTDEPVRVDRFNLISFWEFLVNLVDTEGPLLGPDAEIRFMCGQPGGFFGQVTEAMLEGRWRDQAPEGVWCAYRRGYGDHNWIPTLVSIAGTERRALDLFDHDEWRWALLARSHAVGPEEVVVRSGEEVHVTWPLPAQLRAAMNMVGIPAGVWRWRVAADAPDVWTLLK
jgi:hypothetical protein